MEHLMVCHILWQNGRLHTARGHDSIMASSFMMVLRAHTAKPVERDR
jgi:hypothetical protein